MNALEHPWSLRAEQRAAGRSLLAVVMLGLALLAAGCGGSARRAGAESARSESSAGALFSRGEAAAAAGDTTRAEQYFVAAREAGGDERRIVQRLLAACVADRRYAAAAQYADRYLRHHPRDSPIALAAASLHLALGNLGRARALLDGLVEREPRWPEAHFALASVLREQGDISDAADLHDLEYLKLAPDGPLAELARSRLRRTP